MIPPQPTISVLALRTRGTTIQSSAAYPEIQLSEGEGYAYMTLGR